MSGGTANLLRQGKGAAAMNFDPLSSQGITKALSNDIRAARVIWDHFTGDGPWLARLDVEVYRAFREYLQTRADCYGMEARWPVSPFWQCRHRFAGVAGGRVPHSTLVGKPIPNPARIQWHLVDAVTQGPTYC